MKTKRTRWFDKGKDAHWCGVMKEFAKSGLSVREFCRRHQIGEPLFYSWRRTLAERDRQYATGPSVDQDHSRVDLSPGSIGLAPLAVVSATTEDWAPVSRAVFDGATFAGCESHLVAGLIAVWREPMAVGADAGLTVELGLAWR